MIAWTIFYSRWARCRSALTRTVESMRDCIGTRTIPVTRAATSSRTAKHLELRNGPIDFDGRQDKNCQVVTDREALHHAQLCCRVRSARARCLLANKRDPMGQRQQESRAKLAAYLEPVSKRCPWVTGLNRCALMNVIANVATRSPRCPFIRREPCNLQRSARISLANSSGECRKSGRKANAYVDRREQERTSRVGTAQVGSALEV